ncbi:hypothetical protein BaRGS_00008434 [Batillaria attramentaria]|uniref:Uncharacterized protein n=1 Tax=Batillaria attramentaria TaxID=370345 RepID=A0ABD0LLT9_9CAEN
MRMMPALTLSIASEALREQRSGQASKRELNHREIVKRFNTFSSHGGELRLGLWQQVQIIVALPCPCRYLGSDRSEAGTIQNRCKCGQEPINKSYSRALLGLGVNNLSPPSLKLNLIAMACGCLC